jgi:hypothetical protein
MKKCYKCQKPIKNASWYGLHINCFKKWFKVNSLEKFQNIISQRQNNDKIINLSFFHGKFRKYSATLGKNKYILKIEEKKFPELPANELCQ